MGFNPPILRTMANRTYLISSFFFLAGAMVAFYAEHSTVNILYLLGSIFFLIAAALGVFGHKRQ
jgi:hypothetical protein